ncbi:hypothetical protein CCUS01_09029 [Colletotrichum cuscutae]|uniref:Uncharacterized protein n=1 Tax=Colletotrichum cuscutae TaxID=1209917 RepID=A0AAI9UKH2_9PEZI|nr:hypothetical protein CCUS01_09029 [Colletotrichum cuscutae]
MICQGSTPADFVMLIHFVAGELNGIVYLCGIFANVLRLLVPFPLGSNVQIDSQQRPPWSSYTKGDGNAPLQVILSRKTWSVALCLSLPTARVQRNPQPATGRREIKRAIALRSCPSLALTCESLFFFFPSKRKTARYACLCLGSAREGRDSVGTYHSTYTPWHLGVVEEEGQPLLIRTDTNSFAGYLSIKGTQDMNRNPNLLLLGAWQRLAREFPTHPLWRTDGTKNSEERMTDTASLRMTPKKKVRLEIGVLLRLNSAQRLVRMACRLLARITRPTSIPSHNKNPLLTFCNKRARESESNFSKAVSPFPVSEGKRSPTRYAGSYCYKKNNPFSMEKVSFFFFSFRKLETKMSMGPGFVLCPETETFGLNKIDMRRGTQPSSNSLVFVKLIRRMEERQKPVPEPFDYVVRFRQRGKTDEDEIVTLNRLNIPICRPVGFRPGETVGRMRNPHGQRPRRLSTAVPFLCLLIEREEVVKRMVISPDDISMGTHLRTCIVMWWTDALDNLSKKLQLFVLFVTTRASIFYLLNRGPYRWKITPLYFSHYTILEEGRGHVLDIHISMQHYIG